MSESVPEPKPPTTPEPAEDPWRVAFVEFEKRDTKMVADYREEIDTLLVFARRSHRLFMPRLTTLTSQAGLFSAVLTAFVVESYQSLQEDYTKTSTDLLRQISNQLANSSFPAAPNPSPFQAQRSDVRVNVCWFVSLLLSLVVALFGIFLKQWMRTYMKWTDVTPDREAVALRHFRYRGLETWRLGTFLALLPTLLQLSVILFLSGLLVFLWNLDQIVARVMTGLLTITFSLVATVTLLPAILRTCPYRSPLSEIMAVSFWHVLFHARFVRDLVWTFVEPAWSHHPAVIDIELRQELAHRWRHRSELISTSWVQVDDGAIAQYNGNRSHVNMHISAAVHLCCTTQSQPLWSAAIAAIIPELPVDGTNLPYAVVTQTYCDEVWWPVLGHVALIIEKELDKKILSLWSTNTYSAFRRFSSSMKHSWASLLLHSKRLVRDSDSTVVVMTYMLCCFSSMESEPTSGGPCMEAFMEVLEARYAILQKTHIADVARCLVTMLRWRGPPTAVMLDSLSGLLFPVSSFLENSTPVTGIKFIEKAKVICNGLSTMPTIGHQHRLLLDSLAQLACHVSMATTANQPHERIPEDLKDIMRALQHVDALNKPSHFPYLGIGDSCALALIFVARREPDLFPKGLARAIMHSKIDKLRLWNVACDVAGLDVEGIDVARIPDGPPGRCHLWNSLEARTPNATELLLAPLPFGRILDAYEEQIEGMMRLPVEVNTASYSWRSPLWL
jgi:hypothetical protein